MNLDFLDDEAPEEHTWDWIDEALARGEGFKSEEERQAYIKSLGDPETHPMFARTPEDLKGSRYVDAFRLLQEEDKSPVELANMYKNEGNEFMKNSPQVLKTKEKDGTMSKDGRVESAFVKGRKNMDEAYDRYAYALTFLDRADAARAANDGSELERDRDIDLVQLRSQILANRALSQLNIGNFGFCRDDSIAAIKLWNGNVKAHYRLCKALEGLRQYEKCIAACSLALSVDPSNADIAKIKASCKAALDKINNQIATRTAELTGMLNNWGSIYSALNDGGVRVGYPETGQLPQQFREIAYPHLIKSDAIGNEVTTFNIPSKTNIADLYYPILFLYPQYNTIDVLHHAHGDSLLVEQLAQMFPDDEFVVWDRDKEYVLSEITCYLVLQASKAIDKSAKDAKGVWIQSCVEVAFLNGILLERDMKLIKYHIANGEIEVPVGGGEISNGASDNTITSESGEKLSLQALVGKKISKRTSDFHAWRNSRETMTASGQHHPCKTVVELPMGISISSICRIPGMVMAGGIITLLVFPKSKANGAHKKFITDQEKLGFAFKSINSEGRLV